LRHLTEDPAEFHGHFLERDAELPQWNDPGLGHLWVSAKVVMERGSRRPGSQLNLTCSEADLRAVVSD
jgi:hypothetical protein